MLNPLEKIVVIKQFYFANCVFFLIHFSMNNLFIIENLKVINRILPILKIQVHKNHTKYQFKI